MMSLLSRRLQVFAEPLLRRLGGDIVHALSGSIILVIGAGVVSFVMLSLAARAMPVAEFGHLAMWLSISQMGSVIALFGQEMFILRALNEYTVAGQPELAHGALRFSLRFVAMLPLLLAGAMFLVGHFVLGEGATLMLVVSLYMVGSSLVGYGGHVARYLVGLLLAEGTRETFWKSLTVLALLLLIYEQAGIDAVEFFLIVCGSIAISLAVQGVVIGKHFPSAIRSADPERRTAEWMRSSFRLWVSSVLETLNQYFDVLVIYLLLDAPAAGVYFVATRVANAFGTLLAATHVLATRRIPQLYFAHRIDEANRVFVSMAEVILLCVAGGLIFVVFGAETILGFFGPAFAQYHWALIILVVGTALAAAGGPAPAVLLIAGYEGRYPWLLVANIALRLLGFVVLIPLYGLNGAASAATLSLLVMAVTLNVLCRRWTGIDPSVLGIFRRNRLRASDPQQVRP
jgi:O-antigen/teichoic acid export membrane protein